MRGSGSRRRCGGPGVVWAPMPGRGRRSNRSLKPCRERARVEYTKRTWGENPTLEIRKPKSWKKWQIFSDEFGAEGGNQGGGRRKRIRSRSMSTSTSTSRTQVDDVRWSRSVGTGDPLRGAKRDYGGGPRAGEMKEIPSRSEGRLWRRRAGEVNRRLGEGIVDGRRPAVTKRAATLRLRETHAQRRAAGPVCSLNPCGERMRGEYTKRTWGGNPKVEIRKTEARNPKSEARNPKFDAPEGAADL